MNVKIKVCGMREPQNIKDIEACDVDILGFIFYEKSARYVGEDFDSKILTNCKKQTAGVFVNHTIDYVLQKQNMYNLNYVQIHGNETPEYCKHLQAQTQACIVKAFLIDELFKESILHDFANYCDYFLFDTKTQAYGGSGQKFDWEVLTNMDIPKPFFLSGGISPNDVESIKSIHNPNLFCLDINSQFEIQPALKNVDAVHSFAQQIRAKQKN